MNEQIMKNVDQAQQKAERGLNENNNTTEHITQN